LRQHIGLGTAKRIESLEIWWPTSNTRQVFHNLSVNQFIEIKEFAKEFKVQHRRSFPLRAGSDQH
jgi:ASPIC and UnbV